MADGDYSANALYDLIRKELNSIIKENGAESKISETASCTNLVNDKHANKQPPQSTENPSELNASSESGELNEIPNSKENVSTLLSTKMLHLRGDETQSAAIDTDLQKMRRDLQQSYELFQKMGERFQSINFSSLKSRIKDLNLGKKDQTSKLESEIKNILQKHVKDNTMDRLTAEMGVKFQQHPGEFGNIPELSEFFQTCTQLQHGLEQLKRQRNSVEEMTKRLSSSAEASFGRIDEIHNILHSKQAIHKPKLEEHTQNS
ncbi:uncharacterized protein LOC129236362 [Anastrepha obliqua]|uniref:uncharacterized protein LOC129236362 n=1 Tax=Anastrepha obliqua TaxID=95512 RepID=UPI002409DFA3|nr:uncharacterized protein LOC129236362 [Anastrepha obliqua]